jgi:hypothetical protein
MKTKILVTVAFIFTMAGVAQAQRLAHTSNDLPFYARIERGLIHTDGEWAAIAFYRPPTCVRADFNLLDFFDVPAVFGCSAADPYLDGFGLYRNGPMNAPTQSRLQTVPGEVMPIWFVRWSELEAAIADDNLTIGELAALPSLIEGGATFYIETLHPFQASRQTMTSIVAFGVLEDNRVFRFQATETLGELRHVEIAFN